MKLFNRFMAFILFVPFWAGATCWDLAENIYAIDAKLLRTIAIAESNMNHKAKNINSNGTYDIGLMQINSIHFPRLEKMGVTEDMLSINPCISVLIGAEILNGMISRYGYGWEAVGAYNAGTSKKNRAMRMKYAEKISGIYSRQTGELPW